MLQHQLMVSRQIGLALHRIDDDAFGLERGRRTKLHLRREAGTTHTDDAGIRNLLDDFFGRKLAFLDQRIAAVDALLPFVSLYIYKYSRFRISTGIDNGINLGNLSADRRVNGRRYKATRFGNLCTYFHNITLGNNRLGRSTDVLAEQNGHLGRNFGLDDGLMC